MLVLILDLFEMSPTMVEVLLYMYILIASTRLAVGATIADVGTDLVWSDEHELDMRGHCSFTFSVGFCGAFRLELYPDKNLTLPKYEIYIDRESSTRYIYGLKKYCDPERLLCTNDGMSTGSSQDRPRVNCDGSLTPFWISWNEGTIKFGKGGVVEYGGLYEQNDPEFSHIDYVKMGADDTNTSANFRFERRTGRAADPDMTCRNVPTTTAGKDGALEPGAAIAKAATPQTVGALQSAVLATAASIRIGAAGDLNAALTRIDALAVAAEIPGPGMIATTTTTTTTTTTATGDQGKAAATTTKQSSKTDAKMNFDNCDNQRRPDSENLGMVFEKAANDTTLSPSNLDVEELDSVTSGSCAELCASRKTCVLYSISNTGTCRITSACRPEVVSETNSAILFLKYWG